jgi:hypothetical protein
MRELRQRRIERQQDRQIEIVLALGQGLDDQTGTVEGWKRHGN